MQAVVRHVPIVAMLLIASAAMGDEIIHKVDFSPVRDVERSNPPQLLGDRFIYRDGDASAQFYVKFAQPAEGVVLGAARFTLLDAAGKAVATATAEKPVSIKGSLLVRTAGLPQGTYTLHAGLLDGEGKPLGEALSFAFDRAAVKERARFGLPLPLIVHPQDALKSVDWPIRLGVPLPPDAIDGADSLFYVLEDGKQVPSEIVTRSTWGPDGSPQWLHVHFMGKYRDGRPASYQLVEGNRNTPQKLRKPPTPPLVNQTDSLITVDTGVVKFEVNRKRFAGIEQAWFDSTGKRNYDMEHLMLKGDGGPYVVDGRSIRWDSLFDDTATVTVEEQSLVRVVIVAEGWYQNPERRVEPICRFKTRITAYAGSPLVRVQHHTIIAFDTRMQRIKDIGFHFAAPLSKRYRMGVDGKEIKGNLPEQSTVFLHQDRYDRLRVVGAGGDEIAGSRADGWFAVELASGEKPATDDLLSTTPMFAVMLKDIWQKFPKEVELGRNGVTLHFWPAHGKRSFAMEDELDIRNIYKFWCWHQHQLLDLNLPPDYFEKLKGYPGTMENIPEHALNGNGRGLAIGNEFTLLFGDDMQAGDLPGWGKLVQQDPAASAPPQWNAASGAMGDIAAVDRERFGEIEDCVEQGFLSYTRSVERGNTYGMWNYADTHTYWDVKQNAAELHRVWNNSHYHQVGKTWMLYYRSGSTALLEWARKSTDHYINIDTVNYAVNDDPAKRIKSHVPGAMYHCKGQTHWGAEAYGMQRRDGHAGLWGHWVDPDAALWSWYLDANPRGWDVYTMWRDSVLQYGLPRRGTRREANTTLAIATNLYEATWNADLLPAIHGLGRSLREDEPLENQNPGPMWHPLWINRYYRLTRDPKYIPFILEHAKKVGIKDTWILGLSALGYELSNDAAYLINHMPRLRQWRSQFYHAPGDPYDWYGQGPGPLGSRWGWMTWGHFLHQLNRAGITSLEGGEVEPPAYPAGPARFNMIESKPSATIYVLRTQDEPFDLNFSLSSLGGDLHTTSIVVLSPSGKRIHHLPRVPEISGASSWTGSVRCEADGETGVYRVEFRAHEMAIRGPLTSDGLEASMLEAGVARRTSRLEGYLLPTDEPTPVDLAIASANDRFPCNFIVKDAEGKTIDEGSLFQSREKTSVTIPLDPRKHPLPWHISVTGMASIRYDGKTPTMLLGANKSLVESIRNAMINPPGK